MSKIYSPNKQYSGISAGVMFVNGVGECTDPYLLAWFEVRGYEVEKAEVAASQEPGELAEPGEPENQEGSAEPEKTEEPEAKKGKKKDGE